MSEYYVWTRRCLERRHQVPPFAERLVSAFAAAGAAGPLAVKLHDDVVARAALPDTQQ